MIVATLFVLNRGLFQKGIVLPLGLREAFIALPFIVVGTLIGNQKIMGGIKAHSTIISGGICWHYVTASLRAGILIICFALILDRDGGFWLSERLAR